MIAYKVPCSQYVFPIYNALESSNQFTVGCLRCQFIKPMSLKPILFKTLLDFFMVSSCFGKVLAILSMESRTFGDDEIDDKIGFHAFC